MATETGFLDLMAYARGAQQANLENQADATFALKQENDYFKMLAAQDEAARKQQTFDITRPYLAAETARRLQDISDGNAGRQANQNVAAFTAQAVKDAAAYPPEGRAGYIAAMLNKQMQETQDPRELAALNSFALNQAAQARALNDAQGAGALFNIALGQSQTGVVDTLTLWNNNATWTDPAAIAKQGGELREDGKIYIPGVAAGLDPVTFAGVVRARASQGAGFDGPGTFAPLQTQAAAQAQLDAQLDELNAALSATNQRAVRFGNTIQLVGSRPVQPTYRPEGYGAVPPAAPVFTPQPAAAAAVPPTVGVAPAPAAATGVAAAQPAPGFAPAVGGAANAQALALAAQLNAANSKRQELEAAVRSFGSTQRRDAPNALPLYQQALQQAIAEEERLKNFALSANTYEQQQWEDYLRRTQPWVFGIGPRPATATNAPAFAPQPYAPPTFTPMPTPQMPSAATASPIWLTQPGVR